MFGIRGSSLVSLPPSPPPSFANGLNNSSNRLNRFTGVKCHSSFDSPHNRLFLLGTTHILLSCGNCHTTFLIFFFCRYTTVGNHFSIISSSWHSHFFSFSVASCIISKAISSLDVHACPASLWTFWTACASSNRRSVLASNWESSGRSNFLISPLRRSATCPHYGRLSPRKQGSAHLSSSTSSSMIILQLARGVLHHSDCVISYSFCVFKLVDWCRQMIFRAFFVFPLLWHVSLCKCCRLERLRNLSGLDTGHSSYALPSWPSTAFPPWANTPDGHSFSSIGSDLSLFLSGPQENLPGP